MSKQRDVTVQFRPDSMEQGKGFVSINPQDPRQRVMIECLNKSDDGDLVVIEAKVTIVAPRSVSNIVIPDVSVLMLPQ